MNRQAFLAFDLGAESGRAVVGTLSEERLETREVYRFANVPARIGVHTYWDVLRLWNDVKHAISLAQAGLGGALTSIGVDTWGVDFALLDRNGELIGNPHHYRDARTEGVMEKLLAEVSREEVYSRTGIQFMRINTLYQLYSMVLDKSPALESAARFLMMPDLFNYFLSGSTKSEFTDATTTQFYNPIKKEWDFDLLGRLRIPTHFLPEIVSPGTTLGKMSADLASELNVSRDVSIVAPACHDTASAVAAAPLESGRSAYISSGTWSLVGAEVESPVINEKSLRYDFTNEGGVFGKFRLLHNVQGMWLVQECRRVWASRGKELSYEELTKLASESTPFTALVDPDYPRFIAPSNMEGEIMTYLQDTNQNKPKDEGHLVRIILESLAFKYRKVIEQLEDLTGLSFDQINVVGGGSRNWLLNQLTADFTGLRVVAGPVEATSIGNVLMQAVAAGILGSHEEVRSVVRNSSELRVYEPNPSARVEDAYNRFVALVERRGKPA
jgi:rhamnulokinase